MDNLRDERDVTITKEYITWNDIEDFIAFLDSNLNWNHFTGVYGPARGGLVYATIISNRFNLPYLGAPQRDCLIVDDICDTGDTAMAWKGKGYIIATHYYKTGAKVKPNLFMKFKDDKWLVFPWEEDTRSKGGI